MIPTNRLEQYNSFVNFIKVENPYYYNSYTYEWDNFFKYLEGKTDTFSIRTIAFDNWSFSQVYKLLSHPYEWDEFDDRLLHPLALFWTSGKKSNNYLTVECFLTNIIPHLFNTTDTQICYKLNSILQKHNLDTAFLVKELANYSYAEEQNPAIRQFVFDNIDRLFTLQPRFSNHSVFMMLLTTDEIIFDKYLPNMISSLGQNGIYGFPNVYYLLQHNAQKYEDFVFNIIKNSAPISETIQSAIWLSEHFPKKYDAYLISLAHKYLSYVKKHAYRFDWFQDINRQYKYFIITIFEILLTRQSFEKGLQEAIEFIKQCPITSEKLIISLYDTFKERSIPLLIYSLGKKTQDYSNPEVSILDHLKKHNHEEFYPQLWALLPKTNKKARTLVAHHLATVMGEAAIPNAQKLLDDKKGDIRLAGALILSLIKTEKSTAILRGLLDREKNDDARDAMLEGLGDLINAEANRETVQDAIHQAKNRGKLDKPLMAWLISSDFPPLYEQSGDPLSKEAIDFLFYRMNRTKDIRIDAEAKPLLAQIDKSKSAPFAKVLLKKYFENGADAKLKWCMTLGSILGSDDEMDTIKRKVNEWAEASRGKMAEYAVKALALNGSTKALRAVEFFSRKYKSKNKNIGAAAIESFSIAAEELGITPYDLADSIIPDFGFDGLFKEFEAEGETYRAFINNDFKLAFLNEDNRLLKALPKGTSVALKEEFKEIGKEVRDIVKSQSSRLEQYLVIQRKWSVEKWDTFFRGNPIMFAYAVRVIWAIFDEKQQIITTFQCLEDQTLVNVGGNELDLDDYTEGYQIGMIHPIDLTEETINHWKQALADADVQPIFSQLDRPVIAFKESDRHLTLSNEFNGIHYGGYGFVSKMEKLGWFRGSVVDAGGISSYYKDFSELGITAIIMQNGCIGVGYYEENAELGDLMFVRPKSVKFGSYSYNEPNKREDERLIPFGEVPQIVYSEVMADMLFFKENQIKKEEK